MTTELVTAYEINREIGSHKLWGEESIINDIKRIFCKDLSETEFKLFLKLGQTTGLNPFLKEMWVVKYGNSAAQIFIGRDGYRKSAQRHAAYDYHCVDAVYSNDDFKVTKGEVEHTYNLKDRGLLVGAYCQVQRKGASRPTYVYVELKEYKKSSLWNEKPATMIKKVAEAQALRMAFQELFENTYDESEAWNKNQLTQSNTSKNDDNKLLQSGAIKFSYDEVYEHMKEAKSMLSLDDGAHMAKTLEGKDRDEIREYYKLRRDEIRNNTPA